MSAQIEIPHGDFLIIYYEQDNTWVPKRRNSAAEHFPAVLSLAKAKESIDNLSKQEKSTFIRCKAIYMANDYSEPIQAEVTSLVAKDGKLYACIKLSDGQRLCEKVETLREFTVENVERLSRVAELKKDYNRITEQSNSIRDALTLYVLKPASKMYSGEAVPPDVAALLPKAK